jgi:hypothetical protein
MSEKSLFASICGFFKGLFSSVQVQTSTPAADASANNDGLTGVERYIRNKESTSNQVTSVERYIRNQAASQITGVETYIRKQANAQVITSVEQYIRNTSLKVTRVN